MASNYTFNPYLAQQTIPQAYSYYPQAAPVQTQNSGVIWVQGRAGASAYPVASGASVLLMDSESSDTFYIKTVDASGVPMRLRTFHYTEEIEQPVIDAPAISRTEFDELSNMVKEMKDVLERALDAKERKRQ